MIKLPDGSTALNVRYQPPCQVIVHDWDNDGLLDLVMNLGPTMKTAAVVRVLHARCEVYLRAGDLDAAMGDATRALEEARVLQGGKAYSSLTGQSLLLAARIEEARNEQATAKETAGKAVQHLVETLGEEHPDTRRAGALASGSVS